MGKMTLGYWGIRGRGQIPRLLAAYTGVELEDHKYTDFNKWFGEDKQNLGLDFPNLPYLIDGDFKLTETAAINRYIILQSGHSELLGKTAKDRARVDNLLGVLNDATKDIRGLFWNKNWEAVKAETLEKARTKLDYIKNFIGDKQWALGYLTIADFEIAEISYYFETVYPEEYLNWSFWETIRENFNALPEIRAYYKRENSVKEPFLPPQMAALNPKFDNTLIFGYWGLRGLGQQIRLILSYVGLPFEEKVYSDRQQWFEQDKKNLGFAFPNIPYLIDGQFKLTESSAIQKYVINRSHHKELLGKNVQDSVRIESALGVVDDIMSEMAKNFWKKDEEVIKKTLETVTPKFNSLAKFTGERNTVLEYLTLVDFILAERSYYVEFLFPEQYKTWEFLGRIRDHINGLESTKAYYARENAIKAPFMPPTAFLNPVPPQ